MTALRLHKSEREASKATGIPRVTLQRMAASEEGRALLAEIDASPETAGRAAKILAVADKALAKLDAALDTEDIPPKELAVIFGILEDKLARLAPKGETESGEIVVQVFGGTLASGTAPAQGVAVQVTTKGGRNAQG